MDKTVYQSRRLYVFMDDKYRWITTPEIFNKMGLSWDWTKRKFLDDDEIHRNEGAPIYIWPEDEPEPEPNGNGHKTDKVYKMLYVCPCHVDKFDWLDAIQEVGFNTIHTYGTAQCPWDTERSECIKQISILLAELKKRNMYGCLQVPTLPGYLWDAIIAMRYFDNAIASPVEEPDLNIPPSPSLEEQQRVYDTIKEIAPHIQVWGCFNGGQWPQTMNVKAYDVIMTDSYAFGTKYGPVPGTPAAENNDLTLPWWILSPWVTERKFPMMHKVLPANMGLIDIQQGCISPGEGLALPNIEEEWNLYHKEFGVNSFAVYPHGEGQGMDSICVMTDEETASYGIKNQCRKFMKELDRR